MEDKVLFKILLIIKGNGDITQFLRDGYTYGQIANFINELKERELVDFNEEKRFSISSKGSKELERLNNKYGRKNSDKWIVTEDSSRIEKLGKNQIYLPNRNELNF
jgi:hypothetical protein